MQLRVGRAGSFILPDFATPAEKKRMKGTLCPLHSFWGGGRRHRCELWANERGLTSVRRRQVFYNVGFCHVSVLFS